MEATSFREHLKDMIGGRAGAISTAFDVAVIVLIIVSVVGTAVETMPSLPPDLHRALDFLEYVCVAAFSAEYVIRLVAAERWTSYAFSFMGLIDLAAILPSLLALGFDLRALRSLRLLRIFRLLKLVRYQSAIIVYRDAFRMVKEEIVLFLITTVILLFLAATGIFYFEHDAQPDKFGSIPEAMWWAVATITTVGYGDVYPITAGGRVFTFLVLIIGIGLVAVPSGLMASAISQARKQLKAPSDASRD